MLEGKLVRDVAALCGCREQPGCTLWSTSARATCVTTGSGLVDWSRAGVSVPGGRAARLRETGHVIDLDHLPLLVDRVEHAVPAGPQTAQILRPVRERLRRPRLIGEMADTLPQRSHTNGVVAEETRRQIESPDLPVDLCSSPGGQAQAAARLLMGDIPDRPGLLAGQVPGPSSVELLVDPLFQSLAQLLIFSDGHDNRNDLTTVADNFVGVAGGQLAHEVHANDVSRQSDARTRQRPWRATTPE